ncbi:MAG: PepSY-like domain-containing protein [Flavipsychrobacter sp.]|nr:PepSY-like domain-containing protein [Flavipsychrobacter sp.]
MRQLFLLLALAFSLSVSAQQNISNTSTIPAAVTDAFLKKFPNHADPKWSPNTYTTPTATTIYAVEFTTTMSKKRNEAWIDKNGKIIKHITAIDADHLPQAVLQSVTTSYPGHEIFDVEKIEENGRTDYAFDVKHGQSTSRVKMDKEGKLLE